MRTTTTVDQNGRVLIPASVRRPLGLRHGSELSVTIEDGRVVLATTTQAWGAVQNLFRDVQPPVPVVDSLLDERRTDARHEDVGDVDDLLGA